jgi:hypothetical protein
MTQPFLPGAALLAEVMNETGETRFVDLCSGSGGPWPTLFEHLQKVSGRKVFLTLTDKHPDGKAMGFGISADVVSLNEPIDAAAVPHGLKGIRTLFNGFHHFRRHDAMTVLDDAVRCNQPIAVFEMLQRSWCDLFVFAIAPINLFLLTPFIRPFNMVRIVLTYLTPIAAVAVGWDSIVSVLRCYTPDELLEMAHRTGAKHYVWRSGAYRKSGIPVTFLVGYPTRHGCHEGQQSGMLEG